MILLRVGPAALAELCARTLQRVGTPWLDLSLSVAAPRARTLEGARNGFRSTCPAGPVAPQQKNLVFAMDRLDATARPWSSPPSTAPTNSSNTAGTSACWPGCSKSPWPAGSLGEIRDEIPEIASQILLRTSNAGEVPPAACQLGALNAPAQPRLERWLRPSSKAAIKSLALGTLEEEIDMDEVAHLLGKTPVRRPRPALDLPLRAREIFSGCTSSTTCRSTAAAT